MKDRHRRALPGLSTYWKEKQDWQFEFLVKIAGLKSSQILIDLGCGTLRGGEPLIRYLNDYHYLGIDEREVCLEISKEVIKKSPELYDRRPSLALSKSTGEKFEVHPFYLPDSMMITRAHIIWAFSVLFHMTDAIIVKMLKWAHNILTDNGHIYANVRIRETRKGGGHWQGFPVIDRTFEEYYKMGKDNGFEVKLMGGLDEFGLNTIVTQTSHKKQFMLVFIKKK